LWHGESGGHGHCMRSSAYPVLIGCFGKAIVGSIVTDTASFAIAHYRSNPILATRCRMVLGHLGTPSPLRNRRLGCSTHAVTGEEMSESHCPVTRLQELTIGVPYSKGNGPWSLRYSKWLRLKSQKSPIAFIVIVNANR